MSGKEKPFGSLGLAGAMPRRKTEDQAKIEKILREEQDKDGPKERSRADEIIRLRMLEQRRNPKQLK